MPRAGEVAHPAFGRGTVIQESGDQIVVLFDDAGYRTLSRAIVDEQHLLVRLSGDGSRRW